MQYKYDIAFSYAGEQKSEAQKLSESLMQIGISVFADFLEPERFWGSFLPEELRKVYFEESRTILILLSKEYRDKAYTTFEGRIAAEKNLTNEQFLIIKIDDVELPWLNTAHGFIRWSDFSVNQIVNMIAKKLGSQDPQKKEPLLNRIRTSVDSAVERINVFLDYEMRQHMDKDSFACELLNENKVAIRFSLRTKQRDSFMSYKVFLCKFPVNNEDDLSNGEFYMKTSGDVIFTNHGFFRGNFTPTIEFKSIDELERCLVAEIYKCGESLYD